MKFQVSPKKVAAIHDLSGFGRSSLTMIIPILSHMQIQVCPLPTAVLSTTTEFDNFHFHDLTDQMEPIIKHWQSLDIHFEAIYSGFLGSHHQLEIVRTFIDEFKIENQLVVVDPVLGDNGKLYPTFSQKMVKGMKKLIDEADLITPNITEACLLLDKKYQKSFKTSEIKEMCLNLTAKGPSTVIITSVPDNNKDSKRTAVIAYNRNDERFWKVSCEYIPASYPGTGDGFTSVVLGSLLQGDSLPIAIDRAVNFIALGIRASFGYSNKSIEGIYLEKVLPSLNSPLSISTYELF